MEENRPPAQPCTWKTNEEAVSATDEQLLAAARRGDDEAFHTLVDRHAGVLFRLAWSLVGNAADAEDVLQETLVGAYQHMRRFQGRSTVKTWLTRILMRQAARLYRRRGRRRDERSLNEAAAAVETPGSVADDANRREDIRAALQMLTAKHREALILREFEGLSYAEMARVLQVPQGTVESRLYRARQELKEILRGYLTETD